MPRDKNLRLLIAFATLYVIWGSTYLAIRISIETIPPFVMAASRFLLAGTILFVWARLRGAPLPTASHWRSAALIGTLLLLVGNGGVVWAEQRVSSGFAALVVGAEPLWAVVLDWLRPGGRRPSAVVGLGLITGFAGVALLISPGDIGGETVDLVGAAVLIAATIGWAIGSVQSRHVDTPKAPLMATGINMLAGAAALFIAAAFNGEYARLDPAAISTRSLLAWGYLTIFGAVVGFTAYIWLLRNTTIAKASTYAYVNPVVAVFLGWLVLGEHVGLRTIVAAAVIVAGVVMITTLPYLVARRRGLVVEPQAGD